MKTDLSRRRQRMATVFLLILTLINAATVFRVAPLLPRGYSDFAAFYCGGLMLRSGNATTLYDLRLQYEKQRQFAPDVSIRQAALPYIHPPFEAVLFLPLTYLGYFPAYVVWTIFNVFMLVLSWVALSRTFGEIPHLSIGFTILTATAFVPIVNVLLQGQDSILLLFLIIVSLTLLAMNKDAFAGATLAAGLFKFHLALPMAVILAVRRPRLLLGFVPGAAALIVLSAAIVGWEGLVHYIQYLVRLEQTGAGGSIPITGMPNLHGFVAALPGVDARGEFAKELTIVASIAVMGIAVWGAGKRKFPLGLTYVIGTVVTLMVSYHAIMHDASLLWPVVLLLFSMPGDGSERGQLVDLLLLIVVYVIFLASSLWPWLSPLWCLPISWWVYQKFGGYEPSSRRL